MNDFFSVPSLLTLLLGLSRVGWLSALTDWLKDTVIRLFSSFVDFMKDWLELQFDIAVTVVTKILQALPPPTFLDQYTLCGILSNAGPTVGWALSKMHIVEGMAVISFGFAFYFVRKILTLGQW